MNKYRALIKCTHSNTAPYLIIYSKSTLVWDQIFSLAGHNSKVKHSYTVNPYIELRAYTRLVAIYKHTKRLRIVDYDAHPTQQHCGELKKVWCVPSVNHIVIQCNVKLTNTSMLC